jgi:hypothetical protein
LLLLLLLLLCLYGSLFSTMELLLSLGCCFLWGFCSLYVTIGGLSGNSRSFPPSCRGVCSALSASKPTVLGRRSVVSPAIPDHFHPSCQGVCSALSASEPATLGRQSVVSPAIPDFAIGGFSSHSRSSISDLSGHSRSLERLRLPLLELPLELLLALRKLPLF